MYKVKLFNNISRSGLAGFGPDYEIVDELEGADAVIVRSASLHDIEMPPSVRAVVRAGAGFNNIPIDRLAQQGVVVFNTPGANSNSVKELITCLFLLASRDILGGIQWVRDHADDPDIKANVEKAKKAFVGQELLGRTAGVIGLGNIGSKVANTLIELGMDVYGYDPFIAVKDAWALQSKVTRLEHIDELCNKCEYITIHVPSSPQTIGLIGKKQVATMPEGAVLFNYSRETLIDEEAVGDGLRSGKLRAYYTDFVTPGVLQMPNVVITPHAGAGTKEAEENCAIMAVKQIKEYFENGNIINAVNFPRVNMGSCRTACRLAALHANIPNMIGQIASILAADKVNIGRMANESSGASAYTLLDLEGAIEQKTMDALRAIEGVWRVQMI